MIERIFTDMPARIARLPVDPRGFPIPEFAAIINGVADFRMIKRGHVARCIRQNRCWICGEMMGAHKAFVIGPMCCINRISSEPPSHRDCATFAAKNCPFLANPSARRRERGLPEARTVPGVMIERNPGVAALWMTRNFRVMRVDNGYLIELGEPDSIEFFAEGRPATRAEVDASVTSGLPFLEDAARLDGPAALRELEQYKKRFERLLETVVMS
ncbi:hypothetical protein GR217_34195 [Rhizobium leguminosarum]|uniref:Uncharacterized protein n=1 Tax=Rhizobium ruizarguesonis TaxID=2081791 RepID=A0AAE4YWQ9_9HYPH|nr:hypothetical protein [Rhizobium ruizarguesonis]NEI52671.1 hypothetical protein [Rhizobium ruizarguesonis]